MVSVSVSIVSMLGSIELKLIEAGAKVNAAYYYDVVLSQNLLPAKHNW